MSNKNWRNMQWGTMGFPEKAWFVILCFLLAILIAFICLDGTNTVDIPDWAILLWVVAAGYAAYQNVVGNHLFCDDDADDDDE
ncbi:MAG: hypothetical protein ACI4MJ_11040 [Aristaeellaceae bacterium]